MRGNAPDEWKAAVEFDEANRHNPLAVRYGGSSMADQLYIWQGGVPLIEADLEKAARREKPGKQLPLWI